MPPVLVLLLLASSLSAVQGSPVCRPTNATISAEKDDCPVCVTFTTSICSGYCHTKELVFKNVLSTSSQRVCTYKEIGYETIKLPDCRPGVDPFFTYPVALSCECKLCTMGNSDCTVQSIGPDFCSLSRGFL
ncbi:lutropin subunit beta-like [Ambystoma mexicanum]|uniref:lutropin subunit beta-like n=1 Tax=Ambystoma mexicanum TaxID=8296 RepID=UPI0037E80BDE